jgi:hypothetical protein
MLTLKIYNIIKGVNITIIINIIIKIITKQLRFLQTLIVVYINLYLLYKYLVKLKTT